MDSFWLSFEAVAPIFLMMLLGFVLKSTRLVPVSVFTDINKLIFRVFLPILLFYNIYTTDLSAVFDGGLVAFTVIGILTVFAVGYVLVLLLTKDNRKRGVMLQGFFRSNYAILGIPIVRYVCGDEAGGPASLMVAIVIPLFNVLAVICLERFRGGKVHPLKMLKGIATNPLIIACVAGALLLLSGLTMPSPLESAVRSLSGVASPLAMVVLGASFAFSGVKTYLREILLIVAAKLVIVPFLMLSLAVLLGFRGEALACIMATFAAPVAVSAFSMSQQMGGDDKLAAQAVVFTSALCLFTMFGWIFLLDSLRLL